MKTKSTVARRRIKRRHERVSHKKLRTLRSRKYARKTARKVMRGGKRLEIHLRGMEVAPRTKGGMTMTILDLASRPPLD